MVMHRHISILALRQQLPNDLFTTLELSLLLANYENLGAKIALFLRKGELISLRRGLYTFAQPLRHAPLSSGLLANAIYGPSYVSAEFALCWHGLIPETPATVTSIAMGRSREFTNAFGRFTYRYCRSAAYPIGVLLVGPPKSRFLVASPHKALYDKVVADRRWQGEDPESYLTEDLRIDLDALRGKDRQTLRELAPFMTGRLKKLHAFLTAL